MMEVGTGTTPKLSDHRVATEPPANVLASSSRVMPEEALGLEVMLQLKKPAEAVNEAVMACSSGSTTSGEMVATVTSVEEALGQLCSAFQRIGDLAKSNCQVRNLCTIIFFC